MGMILSSIEGRTTSVTLTCQGRVVTLRQLDDVISNADGIDEYSLEQTAKKKYTVTLVSGRPDMQALDKEVILLLKGLYGREADIKVNHREALLPEESGKYRVARTTFPVDFDDFFERSDIGSGG